MIKRINLNLSTYREWSRKTCIQQPCLLIISNSFDELYGLLMDKKGWSILTEKLLTNLFCQNCGKLYSSNPC